MILVIVAAASLGFALATRFGVIGGPDFREGLVTADRPLSLDPYVGSADQGAEDVAHLLYRSLFRLDASAYPVPDLAAAFTISADGLDYTISLRQGLRWSDGSPMTPADVAATVALAESGHDPIAAVAGGLSGVTVHPFGAGVIISLAAPRASLPALLTELPILPLGRDSAVRLAQLERAPQTALPTSGPYQVSSSSATELLLSGNPHAAEKPAMATLDLRLYSSFDELAAAFVRGDVDGAMAASPAERAELAAVRGARAVAIDTFRFVDLLFNEQTPGLDDPVVRQAIATTVDRQALVDGALAGGGIVQVDAMPAGLRWVAATQQSQQAGSEAAAAASLQADGWLAGAGGVRSRGGVGLAFTVTVPDAAPLPSVVRELAAQLTPLGISLAPDVVPASSFVSGSLVPRGFELAVGDWDSGPDPDLSAFWRSNAEPPHGFNVSGGPADPFLDQALDGLAMLTDRSARVAVAAQVDRLLAQDLPAVFLYSPEVWYVFRIPMRSSPLPPVGGSAARFDDIAAWQRG